MTIIDYFLKNARENLGSVSFWGFSGLEKTYSYGELLVGALKVAKYLRDQQMPLGAKVAIVLPTSEHFYFAFWGVLLAGGVPTALYPPLRLGRIEEWEERSLKMIRTADAFCVLSDKLISPFLAKLCARSQVQFYPPAMEDLISHNSMGLDLQQVARVKRSDLAFIQFSSGSTGEPRAVAITHDNLIHNVSVIINELNRLKIALRGVSWLPLYHDMGLVGSFLGAVYSGGDLCVIRPEQFIARPLIWFQAMSGFRASIGVAPNFAYSLSVEKIENKDLSPLDLSTMKVLMSGAEPIHPDTMEKFYQKFSLAGLARESLLPVYGLAEATLAVTFRPMGQGTLWKKFERWPNLGEKVVENQDGVALAAVGKALAEMTVIVGNEQAQSFSEGQVGKIWIAGPSVAQKENNPLSCQYVGKFLDTGDRGFFYQGELYICGREKDILIIRGRNIDPSPLEQTVSELPEIRSGCVALFPIADEEKGGETPILVAELRHGKIGSEKLKNKIERVIHEKFQLSLGQVILVRAGSLPRTSSGKIQRRRCRELFIENGLNRGAGAARWKALKTLLMGKCYKLKNNLLGHSRRA